MTLGADHLTRMDALLRECGGELPAGVELRRDFPGVQITRCDASDMGVEQPFREYPGYQLYLVDGNDHCWRMTLDPERATGVVIARRGSAT